MASAGKLLEGLRGSVNNVRFGDLVKVLRALGFEQDRQSGSHQIFRHGARPEIPFVNLQPTKDGKAKPYQVRQVLALVEQFKLEVE